MKKIDLIPKMAKVEARLKYKDAGEPMYHRRFASHILKNPYVKSYLLERQDHLCPWCRKPIDENKDYSHIHHIDYDHVCDYDGTLEVHHPTPKRPDGVYKAPDCESCSKKNSESFQQCMSRLSVVHAICNKLINDAHVQKLLKQTMPNEGNDFAVTMERERILSIIADLGKQAAAGQLNHMHRRELLAILYSKVKHG